MKKNNFLLFALLISTFSLQAQTDYVLHTFEDDFENEYSEVSWKSRSDINALHYEMDVQITDNPDKTGINKSDKVLGAKTKEGGQLGWWENTFIIEFDPGYPAINAESRYLHVKYYRTVDDGVKWRFSVNGQNLLESTTPANKWVDLVFDLEKLETKEDGVKSIEMVMRTDWGNTVFEQTAYYIDDIIVSSSSIPRGDYDFIEGNSILNFEDEDDTNSKVAFSSGGTGSIFYDNNEKNLLNSTDKCAYYEGDGTQWWYGLEFNFIKYIKVTDENKYLHFMMRRDNIGEIKEIDITYTLLGSSNQILIYESGLGTGLKLNEAWTEYVAELTPGFIVKMEFKCKGDNAYLDEMWLDNDPAPRTGPGTSVEKESVEKEYEIIRIDNGVEIKSLSGNLLDIEVYTLCGKLYNHQTAVTSSLIHADKGIYIVKINGSVEKVVVQ